MTLVPVFEFGLWNAWIVVVVYLAASFFPFFVAGARADARMQNEPRREEIGAAARLGFIITHAVLMPGTLVYSFFVPLERAGWWLYPGLVVAALGIVTGLAASVAFVTAPLGEPMTRGVYAISRNPMYVSGFLVYVGVGLAAASWVFLVCGVVEIAAYRFVVAEEERNMISKYGQAYERYMSRTPRWIGLSRPGPPAATA
jgi:protein-S-isoprenylcysteine O-methyltransferase Ste14